MSIYTQIKTCSKCKQTKSLDCFGIDNDRTDGHQRYCKECVTIYRAEHYKKNKERIKQYEKDNRPRRREWERNRNKTDTVYKLKNNIRVLILKGFKRSGIRKNTKTESILGCSISEFKLHLESQFDDNMTWDNHGTYWDIDHIIPTSSAITEEDIIRLNHYTNLRPLESHYNRHIKRGKIID